MENWKEDISGNYIDLINGFAFKSKNFIKEQVKNSLPVIKIKNVANGDVNLNDVDYHLINESLEKYIISKGDVLIAMTGNHPQSNSQVVGDVSKYKLNTSALLNQRVGKIVSNEKSDLNFIYYLFKNKDTHTYLANQSSGSANQANISKTSILDLELSFPPLPEQKAIAEVLSSLDDKIDLLHRQNETLEEMAQTLFRQWFVEEAEDSWEEGVLGNEFDFTMGQSPKGDTFNEIGEGVPMYQGNRDFGFRFPTNRVYTTDPKRFAEKFDTLISVRAPVGAQNMANEKCCIGRGVAAFRYKANPEFYSYTYFKMRSLMDEIKKFNDAGTVFGSIGKRDFENLELIIPPYNQVVAFQNRIKPIDDKVIFNTEQIQTLEKLRDTLLPKLMSGEVRVTYKVT